MIAWARCVALVILMAVASPALPENQAEPAPEADPTHDITMVDEAPIGGAIATPLPEKYRRRLKRYEIPELTGSKQAIGSQLIDGRLPKPLVDYSVRDTKVRQRISLFEGGLVVVHMSGAGGTIQKRVILPPDALKKYRGATSARALAAVRESDMTAPSERRVASLRVYDDGGHFVERYFDPSSIRLQALSHQIAPLEDLLRAISEDRTVTSTLANYEPKVGDELVADDRKTYRVARIIPDSGIVELRCVNQPTIIYVAKKDLYNYFVGRRAE
jgi:hypothetical protein